MTVTGGPVSRQMAEILTGHEKLSTKRLAWAFGCCKKGSDEEVELYRILVDRIEKLRAERGAP